MVIKEIIIENFTCYYDVNRFNLSPGLNIILGENGEGKTMFYEALDWLFINETSDQKHFVSRKAEYEMENGQEIQVKVSIEVEQYNELCVVSRQFIVSKENGLFNYSNPNLTGVKQTLATGEREQVDGKRLLDQIFKADVRRYSMFKGEDELNIFENDEALINLIEMFSDAKYYKKYSVIGEFLSENAQKAIDSASAKNKKNEIELKRLNADLKDSQRKLGDYESFKGLAAKQVEKFSKHLKSARKYVRNAKELETINKRIKNIEDEISNYNSSMDQNYTTSLFDEKWILVRFKDIQKKYSEIVQNFSIQKRKAQSAYDKELGRSKATIDLVKGVLPLPVTTPSKEHMEEMIRERVCKVCNRGFDDDIKTLTFMEDRLREYLVYIGEIEEKGGQIEEELFKHNYLRSHEMINTTLLNENKKINKIEEDIKDRYNLNFELSEAIKKQEEKLDGEKKERIQLIGLSSVDEEGLEAVLLNYDNWSDNKTKEEGNIKYYKDKIIKEKDKIKAIKKSKEKLSSGNVSSFLIDTRDVLKDLEQVFKDTEKLQLDDFINTLEEKSNNIFSTINLDSFTGYIKFNLNRNLVKPKISIDLLENNGRSFQPNQSLETSMHISVLLAISEIAKEINEESYPLVFDAPTSSFGETKTTQFLNLISDSKNQIIILIKDYLNKDIDNNLRIKDEFKKVKRDKSFWVKLERPFDKEKLFTLNTKVIEI